MPISLDPMIMREVIMDHYEHPRNKEEVDDPSYVSAHMNSASCIDDITVQVRLSGERIEDVKWHGTACAISSSATSIMSELVKGKTLSQAEKAMGAYLKMMRGEPYDASLLGEAEVFKNTNRQPSRIGCATIGWKGLFQAIGKGEGNKED